MPLSRCLRAGAVPARRPVVIAAAIALVVAEPRPRGPEAAVPSAAIAVGDSGAHTREFTIVRDVGAPEDDPAPPGVVSLLSLGFGAFATLAVWLLFPPKRGRGGGRNSE